MAIRIWKNFTFPLLGKGYFSPFQERLEPAKEHGIVAAFLFAHPNHYRSSRSLLFKEKSFKLSL